MHRLGGTFGFERQILAVANLHCKNSHTSHPFQVYVLMHYLFCQQKDCTDSHDGMPRDLNLAPVWVKHGLFGKGIKVIVVDSGVDKKNSELIDNYVRNTDF